MKLKDYLAERGIKQADFAVLIEADQSTVSRLLNGAIPTQRVMKAIAEQTKGEVTANDFFGIAA